MGVEDERAAQENYYRQQEQQMLYEQAEARRQAEINAGSSSAPADPGLDVACHQRIESSDEDELKKGKSGTPRNVKKIKEVIGGAGSKFGDRGLLRKSNREEILKAKELDQQIRNDQRKALDEADAEAKARTEAEELDELNQK